MKSSKECKDETRVFWMDLDKIRLFEPWEITEHQIKNPSSIDKQRYDRLLEQGYENWQPVVLMENDLLFDGYHRYALAKHVLKKKRIKACVNY
jgi:hypothetical protein